MVGWWGGVVELSGEDLGEGVEDSGPVGFVEAGQTIAEQPAGGEGEGDVEDD